MDRARERATRSPPSASLPTARNGGERLRDEWPGAFDDEVSLPENFDLENCLHRDTARRSSRRETFDSTVIPERTKKKFTDF
jgi:hypothetical protein